MAEATAQMGGGGWGGMRGGPGERDKPGSRRYDPTERSITPPDPNSYEQIDYRLLLLEEDLHLTPPQSAAWQVFASKVRSLANDVVRDRTRVPISAMDSSDGVPNLGIKHLSRVTDSARNRLTALEDIETATRDLYRVSSPDQQKLLDERIPTIVSPQPTGTPPSSGVGLPDLPGRKRPN